MSDMNHYALIVLLVSAVALFAVLSNHLTERVKVPAPLFVLVGAAVAVQVIPSLQAPPDETIERLVTVALVLILFDGGMHIGWSRFRAAAGPIAAVGLAGTFLTTAGAAVLLHVGFDLSWYAAVLVATAVAPTDPAVVFSVLGQREIAGRSGTVLEGESGANDPVGIALMSSLIAAGSLGTAAFTQVASQFVLQMLVGAAVGVAGGRVLMWFMRRVPLPSEGLYPLRVAACAFMLFGVATLAHGSGFLAVFVAGIVIGDGRAPYKREIQRFHSALASLAEIVAFVALGLSVDLSVLVRADVWVPGLMLGAALAVAIRPLLVGACLLPFALRANERNFVLFAGLKGAVPILLGEFIRVADVPHAERLYGIVVVVVIFSVFVQGSLVSTVAHLLGLPMRSVEPEPWALGVGLGEEPEGVHRFTVAPGSAADGHPIKNLADLVGDIWISIVVRDRQLVPIRADTELRPGDEVVVLAHPDLQEALMSIFGGA